MAFRLALAPTFCKDTVHNIMVRDVITIDPDTTIEETARVMADANIGCLPVLQDGNLVGIITERDLLNITVNLWASVVQVADVPAATFTETVGNIPDTNIQDIRKM